MTKFQCNTAILPLISIYRSALISPPIFSKHMIYM